MPLNVEFRKLHVTRSGSYLVSLPKRWVTRVGLKSGSLVEVLEIGDGSLLVKPKITEEEERQTVAVIELSDVVGREVLGNYLLGADVIRIKSPHRITLSQREKIKEVLAMLTGIEIVEEKPQEIVLQCLLSPLAIPIKTLLRRASILAFQMHTDAITALKEHDYELAGSVINRDSDLNKIYFLIVRQLRAIIQNPSLSEKAEVSLMETLDYRLVARALESIGDQAVSIARNVISLKDKEVKPEVLDKIVKLSELIKQMQEKAMQSLFNADIKQAEILVRLKMGQETLNMIEDLNQEVIKEQSPVAVHLSEILTSLRRIRENCIDIADLVIRKPTIQR